MPMKTEISMEEAISMLVRVQDAAMNLARVLGMTLRCDEDGVSYFAIGVESKYHYHVATSVFPELFIRPCGEPERRFDISLHYEWSNEEGNYVLWLQHGDRKATYDIDSLCPY